MKKLFNLKQWLTVAEAARHLSILFGEDVSEADILRLALDGELLLSVHFLNKVRCSMGLVVKIFSDSATELFDDRLLNGKDTFLTFEGTVEGYEGKLFEWSQETIFLDGVWDLSTISSELALEQQYRTLTNKPAILVPQNGSVERPILRGPDGTYYRIVEGCSAGQFGESRIRPQDNVGHSVNALPDDSILVVRTSELRALEARTSEPDQKAERPLGRRERTTLLVIIAALAELAKIDVTKPAKAGATIESQTSLLGAQVSSRAIQDHLKLIPEALGRRDK